MFEAAPITAADKPDLYAELAQQATGLLHGETNLIANAANFAALVFHALPDINWCGFYFLDGEELVVGPFQGKPACIRIALGRGVCGTAAESGKTQRVDDVEAFPGHIACDAASRSELVIPLMRGNALVGVLDIDSPITHRFDEDDQKGLEAISALYVHSIR
jgi:GAF domain-containing protein